MVTVTLHPATAAQSPLSSAQFPGLVFHAAQFAGNGKVIDNASAFGGKAVRGTRWYCFCREVPFPQGDGVYHVYLRAKSEGPDNPLELARIDEGRYTVLASRPSPPPGQWTWLEFAPLSAKAAGPWLAVHGGGQNAAQWTQVDGIVISRTAGLPEATLDEAAHALPPETGLLAAPWIQPPPVIDGLVEDACYRSPPEAYHLTRLGEPRFAQAQARIWTARDGSNLYVAAQLDEPLLDPRANRLGDFQKTVTQHDGQVWSDDSFEVWLDPSCAGREVYRFVVNALGTLYDAHGNDSSYESGAAAKGRVGDAAWTVELSIPLTSLGIDPAASNALLAANFARHRPAAGETSTWSPANRLEDLQRFGRIWLAGPGSASWPAARLENHNLFRFGQNRLRFSGQAEGHVTAFIEVLTERGRSVRASSSGQIGPQCPPLELGYLIGESGRATLHWLLVDDQTSLPVYRSPVYPGEVAGTVAEAAFRSDGAIEVFANWDRLAAGPAQTDVAVQIPLVDGINALAVRTTGTTLSGRIRAANVEIPVDSSWRWAPESQAVTKAIDLDKLDKVVEEGGAVKAPAAGGVFRKSIAANVTRAWPNYGEALQLAQGSTQWFHLKLRGIRGLPSAKRPVVVIDVPGGIELIDAAGYYGKKRKEQPRFTRQELGPACHHGETFRRTAFRSDLPLRTVEQVNILNLFSAVLRASPEGPLKPGSQTQVFYYLEDAGGAIVELPRALPIRIAEPLDGVQPKGITLECWPGWLSTFDGDTGRAALLETVARAGFNEIMDAEDRDAAHRHGLRVGALVNFEPWVLNLAPYLQTHASQAQIDATGKPSSKHLCPCSLLDGAWAEAVDRAIAAWLERLAPDHVNWDFESSAFTGELACYDERCLAAFRKGAGLPPDLRLTPAEIGQNHSQAWVKFTNLRTAEVARRFRESVKRHRPEAIFSMYSGYQCAMTKEIYNVDWTQCAPHLDLVMAGYGRRVEEVVTTRTAAGRTPCVFGSITHPYDFNDDSPVTTITSAEVLRRLCDARGGVLFYDLNNADARTLAAFAKVSRVAARFEVLFRKGAQEADGFTVRSGKAADVYIFTLNGERLLCLVNDTKAPVRFEIECPGSMTDFFTGKLLPGKTLSAKLPGGGIGVFAGTITP